MTIILDWNENCNKNCFPPNCENRFLSNCENWYISDGCLLCLGKVAGGADGALLQSGFSQNTNGK